MGGVRTALYNYLFAKKNGGDFILRIEDTDSHRFVPGAEEYIIEALRWCGIVPDEGVDENGKVVEVASEKHPHAPYRQSQRRGIYRQYADQLVEGGFAYYAFDTSEELEKARAEAEAKGETFIYNYTTRKTLRNSLTLPAEEVARLLEERTDWTVRFKMPEDTVVKMDDLIRGHIEVNTSTLDDKVLWKRADELPTYHLANIVDDHLMEITEVIRGEEWLPSLPLHYLLYQSFGWTGTMPRFAHLPLLLKPVGNGKLSKRDGDKMGFPVFPLNWKNSEGETYHGYREDGYFPEAFVNLLAMLGWNPGTEQELFSLDELVEAFSIDKVSKSGAKFNPDKAKWYNKEYLRMKGDAELAALWMPSLAEKGIKADIDRVTHRATFSSTAGVTDYDRDAVRSARILASRVAAAYGMDRTYSSGLINVSGDDTFRYGWHLDIAKLASVRSLVERVYAGEQAVKDRHDADLRMLKELYGDTVDASELEAVADVSALAYAATRTSVKENRDLVLKEIFGAVFTDYTGKAVGESPRDVTKVSLSDLFLDDGRFDFAAIEFGEWKKVSRVDGEDGKPARTIYLGG